jgi:hypothetical protein
MLFWRRLEISEDEEALPEKCAATPLEPQMRVSSRWV